MKRVLDLYCGAGGAAMGYYRAFGPDVEIVGVDILPMPDFPFEFVQADALEYAAGYGAGFDLIHASPPCQVHSAMQHIHKNHDEHQDLIAITRDYLNRIGKPYVIENVPGAPLENPLMLCGTMLGLRITRHRLFESNCIPFCLLPPCDHRDVYDPWHGTGRSADQFRAAMGIDWMRDAGGGKRRGTLAQAIPPAYTEWIGRRIMEAESL